METLIGEVPDGWVQLPLGEVCDVLAGPSGASIPSREQSPTRVPMVTPKDIRDNQIVRNAVSSVELDVAQTLSRYRLTTGDIVCPRAGELGRCALIDSEHAGWLLGTACLRLRPHSLHSSRYLIYFLAHPAIREWVRRNATGSAIPSISSRTLRGLPVVLPPRLVQSSIGEILGALDDKINVHGEISRAVADLRDSLLPVLMTGALSISGICDPT